MTNPAFHHYNGIDHSGAKTPNFSLKGLLVYEVGRDSLPVPVIPPPSPRNSEVSHLEPDWPAFLDDFQQYWSTDTSHSHRFHMRRPEGRRKARSGSVRWRRITRERAGAKLPFYFDVPGSTAKSTHARLPRLRFLRRPLGNRIHFKPLVGWRFPAGESVSVEVYPSLWSKSYPREDRIPD